MFYLQLFNNFKTKVIFLSLHYSEILLKVQLQCTVYILRCTGYWWKLTVYILRFTGYWWKLTVYILRLTDYWWKLTVYILRCTGYWWKLTKQMKK